MYWEQFLSLIKKVALLFPLYYVEYEWNEYHNGEWHTYSQAGVLNTYAVEHVKESALFYKDFDKLFCPGIKILSITYTQKDRHSWVPLSHYYVSD